MPAAYAHYTFGRKVLSSIQDAETRRIITENRELFDIGLHGPDILFYYKPLQKNQVNRTGHLMHQETAAPFFRQARRIISRNDHDEASLAYILGFICHYALDSECHGYIEEITKSGISRTEIETEFDRSILLHYGQSPLTAKTAAHIHITSERAACIAQFFPTISADEVKQSVRSFKRFHHLLATKSLVRRQIIFALFRLGGHYDSMRGLVMNFRRNPKCAPVCRKLSHLYIHAIPVAETLIETYVDELYSSDTLNDRFNRNFE